MLDLAPFCIGPLVVGIRFFAKKLIQDHIHTVKKSYQDFVISAFIGACFVLLRYQCPSIHFVSYGFFFFLLSVTLFTDTYVMLISRWVTVCCIPLGLALNAWGFLEISLLQSILGIVLGGGFLLIAAKISHAIMGQIGTAHA